MLDTLIIVLPIFALVSVGWLAGRRRVLGPQATTELNRFVVKLALPALLFDITATASLADLWQPGFILAFGGAAALLFAVTVLLCLRRSGDLVAATIQGLNAAYANTGFVGFPLAAAALGSAALAPTLLATILTACVLYAVALVLIEIGGRAPAERSGKALLAALLGNPLLLAPVAGVLFPLSGIGLPAPVASFFDLLGHAAAPCALVALGLFLAEARTGRPSPAFVGLLVATKLLLQPLLTWALAALVFHLPPALTTVAVLMAALPTGTGSFMLAELHGREAMVTSQAILVSTLCSVLSVTLWLTLLR